MLTFPYICEMLIDQNKYIGEDPIGHSCSNKARFTKDGYLICEKCLMILENEPERITFPKCGHGKEFQDEIIRNALIEIQRTFSYD